VKFNSSATATKYLSWRSSTGMMLLESCLPINTKKVLTNVKIGIDKELRMSDSLLARGEQNRSGS